MEHQLPTFHTKASLAREAKVDHRSKHLAVATPVGQIVIGGHTFPVYSAADIGKVTAAHKEQSK
jgi:hypothetical protein